MSEKKVLRVSEETDKAIRKYAKDRKLDVGVAADKLIGTAVSRLNALSAYAVKQAGDPKPKKVPKAAAKKAAPKKTAAKAPRKPRAKKGKAAPPAPVAAATDEDFAEDDELDDNSADDDSEE